MDAASSSPTRGRTDLPRVLGDGVHAGAEPGARWFSANPSKAWGEKFFLLYTPFWMVGMGVLMQGGAGGRWGDLAINLAILAIFAPLLVVPLLVRDETTLGRRWFETYWFKFNCWIGIFAGIGTYFLTEYFFDVLGMVYDYPNLTWRFDSVLLGSGAQTVPLIMYLSAHFYFVTYHTASVIVMRRARTSRVLGSPLLWPLTVLATAYTFAWAETFMMTGGTIAEQFYYQDMPRMLRWGSLFYACYFFVSFPMVYRLDENPDDNWSLRRTCVEALAAAMLVFLLLDLVTRQVGTLSQIAPRLRGARSAPVRQIVHVRVPTSARPLDREGGWRHVLLG